MSKPTVLSLESPALQETVLDIALLQRWEILRRSQRELAPSHLATAWRCELAEAQRSLDQLVESGLAVRLKASRSRRHVAYRAVASEVSLVWDPESPKEVELVKRYLAQYRAYSREILDRHDSQPWGSRRRPYYNCFATIALTSDEYTAIGRLTREMFDILDTADRRAEARAAGKLPDSGMPPGESPYHLAFELWALYHQEPPMPHLEIWDKASIAKESDRAARSASNVLTAKETDVARRLAAGESRPEIAKAVGLTVNTIASTTKRVYAKLGVRNRAELVARMRLT